MPNFPDGKKVGDGTPGPGRPRGAVSGRTKLVYEIDRFIMGKIERRELQKVLSSLWDKDPKWFIHKVLIPLCAKLKMDNEPTILDIIKEQDADSNQEN
jgi:hypothetical protein